MRTHPHADATYLIVPLSEGGFGVQVKIPDSYPTTVTSFATELDAEAWIEKDKGRVVTESEAGKWFRKPGGRPGGRPG